MTEILKYWAILAAILKDGKISKEEVPAFLEALAGLIVGIISVLSPFLAGRAQTLATNLGESVKVAAVEAKTN